MPKAYGIAGQHNSGSDSGRHRLSSSAPTNRRGPGTRLAARRRELVPRH
jgi:hypothetical protein